MDRADPLRALLHGAPLFGDFVRITVVEAQGSVPRDPGTSMAVMGDRTIGTIGGGRLEFEAIATARRLLLQAHAQPAWHRETEKIALGPSLGQCCGGAVRLLFALYRHAEQTELARVTIGKGIDARSPGIALVTPMAAGKRPELHAGDLLDGGFCVDPSGSIVEPLGESGTPLFVYGAGHVGRALVPCAATLGFEVYWVDTSTDRFPEAVPDGIERVVATEPDRIAQRAPENAFHIVMTYAHPIDLAICNAILSADAFEFLGLIGSQTKAQRFRRQLRDAGISERTLSRLVCPIGIPEIESKHPSAIAVSVAAQLQQTLERASQYPHLQHQP